MSEKFSPRKSDFPAYGNGWVKRQWKSCLPYSGPVFGQIAVKQVLKAKSYRSGF
jgi:hypothetical protein